jgi:hypothetical protein
MLSPTVIKAGLGVSGSAFFTNGMSSSVDPMFIDDRSYRHAQNTIHRGGIIRTRPGYRQLFALPAGKLQGFYYFRPISGDGRYVAIVAGRVYESSLVPNSDNSITYTQVPNIQLYAFAKEVYACTAVQASERNSDGTISVVAPKRVLFLTDGGYTKTAFWDGASSGHINPLVTTTPIIDAGAFVVGTQYTIVSTGTTDFTLIGAANSVAGTTFVATGAGLGDGTASTASVEERIGTPVGGPVEFSGDRLWLARNNLVFASDISNPFSFEENEYAGEGGYFQFPERVVALRELPSADNPVLVVFCVNSTWVLRSNVRNRSAWKTTDQFQRPLLSNVGCVSSRSVLQSYGMLWWMSPTGLVNIDVAQAAYVTSKLVPQDTAMAVSKSNLWTDLSETALGFYENFIVCSVPNGDRFNRHTWALDQTVLSDSQGSSTQGWSSVWTGTRPVQWATGLFNNSLRCAHASVGPDGSNIVWESFVSEGLDDGLPILSFLETKAHLDFGDKAGGLNRKRFKFAEVSLEQVRGDVNLKVYWAGTRGRYKLLGEWNFAATEGSADAREASSYYETYNPQQRVVRTPAVQGFSDPVTCTSRGVESVWNDWIDVAFSILIVWSGPAAIRSYRIFADGEQEASTGDKVFDETGDRVLLSESCGS